MTSTYQQYLAEVANTTLVKQAAIQADELLTQIRETGRINTVFQQELEGFIALEHDFLSRLSVEEEGVEALRQQLNFLFGIEGKLRDFANQWTIARNSLSNQDQNAPLVQRLVGLRQLNDLASLDSGIAELNHIQRELEQQADRVGIRNLRTHSRKREAAAQALSLENIRKIIKEQHPQVFDEISVNDFSLSTHHLVELEKQNIEYVTYDVRFGISAEQIQGYLAGYKAEEGNEVSMAPFKLPFSDHTLVSQVASKFIPVAKVPEFKLALKQDQKIGAHAAQPYHTIGRFNQVIDCESCRGALYVACRKCSGSHKLPCRTCQANGKVDCPDCRTAGKVTCQRCHGGGQVKCSSCKGNVMVRCRKCDGTGVRKGRRCSACVNGLSRCRDCTDGLVTCKSGFMTSGCGGSGKVDCKRCGTSGKVSCSNCKGNRYFDCDQCYGDATNRITFGKVDCPGCRAKGKVGLYSYIQTKVHKRKFQGIYAKAPLPKEGKSVLFDRRSSDAASVIVQEHFPGNLPKNRYDEETKQMLRAAIPKTEKIPGREVAELIYFEAIPVATVNFKHTITKLEHQLLILGVDHNPEIVFLSDPREGLETTGRWRNLFRKAIRSKVYKNKLDSRNAMVLLIYIAKLDGVIEEREKRFITKASDNLSDFTQAEIDEIFKLMEMQKLPPLTKKYTRFSSTEVEAMVARQISDMLDSEEVEKVGRDLEYYLRMLE